MAKKYDFLRVVYRHEGESMTISTLDAGGEDIGISPANITVVQELMAFVDGPEKSLNKITMETQHHGTFLARKPRRGETSLLELSAWKQAAHTMGIDRVKS